MRIILASKSPRRKELLTQMGLEFDVMVSDAPEVAELNNGVGHYVRTIALEKAKEVQKLLMQEETTIISADTIVWFNNEIMGKPKDEAEAFEMLKKLQNSVCEVHTGLCVLHRSDVYLDTSVAIVYFQAMTDKEIRQYIKTGEPMDKAGAFAIQGHAAKYIKKIEGDYYATVGLPINKLYNILKGVEMI